MIIDQLHTSDISELMPLLLEADPSIASIKSYVDASAIFAASENEKVIGVAVVQIGAHEAEIKNIAVVKEFRGRGIGRALLAHLRDYAAQKMIKKITVGTGNSSLYQLRFYQLSGFRIVAVEKDYFDQYPNPIYEDGIRCRDLLRLEIIL